MADFTANLGSFSSTEIVVSANTIEGKALMAETFGHGSVSATMPKSQGPAFAAYVEKHGLSIN